MKKYILPAIEIVEIETQQMLAASLLIDDTIIDGSEALSREFDDEVDAYFE